MTVEAIRLQAQFLADTADTLSVQFYEDGAAGNPGVTTVAIATEAGATVIASTQADGTGTGVRSVALTGTHTASLDRMVATWTTTNYGVHVTRFEVVGAFLFTISEARNFDNGALSNKSAYPQVDIEEARARITDEFEQLAGVGFIPRYRRDVFAGTGETTLSLGRRHVTAIRSVEARSAATWTAYTTDELADVLLEPWGYLTRESRGYFTSGTQNIRVGYEYGYAEPPGQIKRAALLALRYELVPTNVDPRAISISTETGSTNLWTPGLSGRGSAIHPLPEVDRALRQWGESVPVIA